MSISEEIKQTKPFKSANEKAIINIIYTNNWLYFNHNKFFRKHGVSLQQYNVLRILNGQQETPLTINSIIDRMLDKMSNASRLVDKLYNSGYVERKENKADRRACDITITNDGIKKLKLMDNEITLIQDNLTNLNSDEANQLSDLLDKMRTKIVQ